MTCITLLKCRGKSIADSWHSGWSIQLYLEIFLKTVSFGLFSASLCKNYLLHTTSSILSLVHKKVALVWVVCELLLAPVCPLAYRFKMSFIRSATGLQRKSPIGCFSRRRSGLCRQGLGLDRKQPVAVEWIYSDTMWYDFFLQYNLQYSTHTYTCI